MNIALIGYGKMGRQIEQMLPARGHSVVMVIDQDNTAELTAANLRALKVDVAIEFTMPETAFGNVMACLEAGVGVVCGTTGWTDKLPEAEAYCREHGGAFFYAPNYSVGVNMMFRLNEELARMMDAFPQYDVTVEEVHHTAKKDAPSGTAIAIADGITSNLARKEKWVGQTTTEPAELEVLAVRRGVVPGIHTITYESPDDVITISHSAKSRRGLAEGAILAAEFIHGKTGVFSMKDMLGL